MGKTIVLTGGGTAGHVTPNLAIIPKLKDKGFDIQYIGTRNGIEREIIKGTDIPYNIISAGKLRRYFSIQNFIDPFKIIAGTLKAFCILKKLKPKTVFSKGGFISVPVVFAAKRLGIRVILHESDYTPGLANKICIPRADKVCVAFPPTLEYIPQGKGIYTGLPIRSEITNGDRQKGLDLCGFSGDKPVLLIMGGSLGAKALNDTFDNIMSKLTDKYDVIHIRGKQNLIDGTTPNGYKQFGFVEKDIGNIYAAADIMVSRAGATAVFEILALAMPALLIPLPKASSRGDQIQNAEYFEQQGYSHTLSQERLNNDSLFSCIEKLYKNKATLKSKMGKAEINDVSEKIAEIIANE